MPYTFQPMTSRTNNQRTALLTSGTVVQPVLRLALASIAEEVTVETAVASERRDNGFTQTLSQEEIDGLSDDPDEMADQLAQMAGPGARIFVDGFRGGRLPPKDQIQQVRFRTNSYAAEYHDAGMVRVEVITRPGMGDWRSRITFGFRDTSRNARNAFASTRPPEQTRRVQVSSQGPIKKGKTSVSFSAEGNSSYDAQTIVAATPTGDVRDQVRRPKDVLNTNMRLEHALSPGNSIRAEYQRRTQNRDNLGVGDFSLQERAWSSVSTPDTLRVRYGKTENVVINTEKEILQGRHIDRKKISMAKIDYDKKSDGTKIEDK